MTIMDICQKNHVHASLRLEKLIELLAYDRDYFGKYGKRVRSWLRVLAASWNWLRGSI